MCLSRNNKKSNINLGHTLVTCRALKPFLIIMKLLLQSTPVTNIRVVAESFVIKLIFKIAFLQIRRSVSLSGLQVYTYRKKKDS